MNESSDNKSSMFVVDVPAIMEKAGELVVGEAKFTFTTDGKSITFAASIPDCTSEEMGYKIRHMGALADVLVEHAYRRDEYGTDCEDEDKHDKWGVRDVA